MHSRTRARTRSKALELRGKGEARTLEQYARRLGEVHASIEEGIAELEARSAGIYEATDLRLAEIERSSADGVRAVHEATETAGTAQTRALEGAIAAKRTTLDRLAAEKVASVEQAGSALLRALDVHIAEARADLERLAAEREAALDELAASRVRTLEQEAAARQSTLDRTAKAAASELEQAERRLVSALEEAGSRQVSAVEQSGPRREPPAQPATAPRSRTGRRR